MNESWSMSREFEFFIHIYVADRLYTDDEVEWEGKFEDEKILQRSSLRILVSGSHCGWAAHNDRQSRDSG
mgnify:CR=1 FL=1